MMVHLELVPLTVAFFYIVVSIITLFRIVPFLRFAGREVVMGFYHVLSVSLIVSVLKILYIVVPLTSFKRVFMMMSFGLVPPFVISVVDFLLAVYQMEGYFTKFRSLLRWLATFSFALSVPFLGFDWYMYLSVFLSVFIGVAGLGIFVYALAREGFYMILRRNSVVAAFALLLFLVGLLEAFLLILRKQYLPVFSHAQFLFVLAVNEAIFSRLRAIQNQVKDSSEELQKSIELREKEIMDTLEEAVSVLEMRDAITGGQSKRVSAIAVSIAEAMGLPPADIEVVRRGAMLHDIGKIAIPDRILLKPSSLNPEEKRIMQSHVMWGWKILSHLSFLENVLPVVYYHHERVDGKGYVEGVPASSLPLTVRIVTVADAFDAMIFDRPYRKGTDEQSALEELRRNAGTQFDPEVVSVLEMIVKRKKSLLLNR